MDFDDPGEGEDGAGDDAAVIAPEAAPPPPPVARTSGSLCAGYARELATRHGVALELYRSAPLLTTDHP